jgi:DUF1365 family protein
MSSSAIYQGSVRHRRMSPVEHEFEYKIFMMYLDLAELGEVFSESRLFSVERRTLAKFCRSDHLGDAEIPLDESVRNLVEEETGDRPIGPIRLLTHLRYFGYVFNPVSFYYCYSPDGQQLQSIVAEVNNTPWQERHCYVLTHGAQPQDASVHQYHPAKKLHVSPFMPMDVDYNWRFCIPGQALTVHMGNSQAGNKIFDVVLLLNREKITAASLKRVLIAFPVMTLKIIVAIHWQALKLWLKRCPVIDHPDKNELINMEKNR